MSEPIDQKREPEPLEQLSSTDLYVDGEWVPATDGSTLETIDPATEEPIVAVAAAQADDIDAAVTAARDAFPDWRDTDPDERGRIVYEVGRLIRDHADDLAALESLDQGKPVSQAKSDVIGAARYFEYYAGAADKIEGTSVPVGPEQVDYTVREPYGVSAQITPWNFPGNLFARGVAPALVAGNATVVKPAEQTPLSSLRLAELCAEAGVPDGVVNVVPGFGDPAGKALTEHEGVDQITFTGSVPTGQRIMTAAAETVTPVTLELGGKNPAIVFPDADLEAAAEWITTGIFTNAGQICSAADRAIVHESVHEDLVEKIVEIAESTEIAPGSDDADMGPVVSAEQLEKITRYIDVGTSEGATLETGGETLEREGYFVEPTVFTDVTNDMTIAREEIFGPVLSVIEFSEQEEAIEIANDSPYGLMSGIWTNDLKTAHTTADYLDYGMVSINEYPVTQPQTPFGGFKESGSGREQGTEAIHEYTQTKNVNVNLD